MRILHHHRPVVKYRWIRIGVYIADVFVFIDDQVEIIALLGVKAQSEVPDKVTGKAVVLNQQAGRQFDVEHIQHAHIGDMTSEEFVATRKIHIIELV